MAGIKLWDHKIRKEYLPNTEQQNRLFLIFLSRENIFIKYVTFVYSILSGTHNCQADKPLTLSCLEISAPVTDPRITQNTNI